MDKVRVNKIRRNKIGLMDTILRFYGTSELDDKIDWFANKKKLPDYQELIPQLLKIVGDADTFLRKYKRKSQLSCFKTTIIELIELYSRSSDKYNSTSIYFVKELFFHELDVLYCDLRHWHIPGKDRENNQTVDRNALSSNFRCFWEFLEICRDTSTIGKYGRRAHKNKYGKKIFSYKKTILDKLHEINDPRLVNYLSNVNIVYMRDITSNDYNYYDRRHDITFGDRKLKINWNNEFMNYKLELLEDKILEMEHMLGEEIYQEAEKKFEEQDVDFN